MSEITASRCIGFLLTDNFTMISLASAIEPLRMANQLSGKELYRWYTLTDRGQPVRASDGIQITPDTDIHTNIQFDMVIVCGGIDVTNASSKALLQWINHQARRKIILGAICTGSYLLAKAGLMDGYHCAIHWEYMASLQEEFPNIEVSNRLFCIDRDRVTCTGGTAPMDMMLNLIGKNHSQPLSAAISDMFIYERIRNEADQQRVPLKHMLGTTQPKLVEIVSLMEANLEEPICLDELALYVGLSRRQLERLFQKYLHCSPSRYYLKLRLTRARQLLKQTRLSIIEVATACGFVSTPHFSKCYRDYFGIPPRDERQGLQRGKLAIESIQPLDKPVDSADLHLMASRNESTFASVNL